MITTVDENEIETLRNAASMMNSRIISKMFIKKPIKFYCLEKNETKNLDEIYQNDKNVINTLYLMMNTIEKNNEQQKLVNQIIKQKDTTIKFLNDKIFKLEKGIETSNKRYKNLSNSDLIVLKQKNCEILKQLNQQTQKVNKLKNWAQDINTRYKKEIKRKNIEMEEMREIFSKKKTNSTISNESAKNIAKQQSSEINSGSNNQNIDENVISARKNILDLDEIFYKEVQASAKSFEKIIDSLKLENLKFSKYIVLINEHICNLDDEVSKFEFFKGNAKNYNDSIVTRSQKILNFSNETIKKNSTLLEPFETQSVALTRNFQVLYNNVINLLFFLSDKNKKNDSIN